MQSNDIIIVNVVGTNGTTRQQRTITAKFDGFGAALKNDGTPDAGVAGLKNLPSGDSDAAPAFPQDEYTDAGSDVDKIRQVMLAHAERVEAWQKSMGGGSENLVLAKSIQDYCVDEHGFIRADDADAFVLTLDDIDVKVDELKDGRKMYTVAGTAVFGA